MYEYGAIILAVTDGDTVRADVDLGFSIRQKLVLRLYGVNSPELHGVADPGPGLKAKEWLANQILGKVVTIKTHKDQTEKYGRILAEIFLPGDTVTVNRKLVEAGHAKEYFGGAR